MPCPLLLIDRREQRVSSPKKGESSDEAHKRCGGPRGCLVDRFRNALDAELPKFQATGEAFDVRACMKDKSILSIPASSAVPFIKTIQESMAKVATQIGFTLKVWENQGQLTQWVQGFDYAINNKFQLIDLLAGADPRFLEPQVKAAKAAGLKVVGCEQPMPGGVTGAVPID
jgi:ribose transport system substrate-binding protein